MAPLTMGNGMHVRLYLGTFQHLSQTSRSASWSSSPYVTGTWPIMRERSQSGRREGFLLSPSPDVLSSPGFEGLKLEDLLVGPDSLSVLHVLQTLV